METTRGRKTLWIAWALFSIAGGAYLSAGLLSVRAAGDRWLSPVRAFLLPGETSDGHHQIELACETCHGVPFGGRESLQEACVRCHGSELAAAEDKHPLAKFLDPRNADRLVHLDARQCVTCHVEHRPEVTGPMAVTLPEDLCFHCHQQIADEHPSHAGMGFDTCASSGCHNFHDNRALYEDFLARHLGDPDTLANPVLPARDYHEIAAALPDYPSSRYPSRPLLAETADAPVSNSERPDVVKDWLASSHARAGVNCSACHQDPAGSGWIEHPGESGCRSCHALEIDGFLAGKHGMRVAQKLGRMSPDQARLPMRQSAAGHELGCTTCHDAHRFRTDLAAVEKCLVCHADEHSLAYESSPHFALWQEELAGTLPAGSGVSCASCHMPRVEHRDEEWGNKRILVQHNQNDVLRPNEKMLRPVCLNCHGLGFAIDSLADPALVNANFRGRPGEHIRSLDMVAERLREHDARRQLASEQLDR